MNENYIDDLYKNITSKDESFSGKFNLESFREKTTQILNKKIKY